MSISNKTPDFWYRPPRSAPSLTERFLTPISWLYHFGFKYHQGTHKPKKASMPVVCIGNLNAGGTGKTPTSIAICEIIRKNKIAKAPHFLLRGYGGGERGPLYVQPKKHTAWDTGDEALVLAEHAPTVVSADRIEGTELAAKQSCDLIVMDDGLQNPGIFKDIKFVVINGDMGFGNRKLFPAGPLREPLKRGLARVDAFILIGKDKRETLSILPEGKPVFTAHLEPDLTSLPDKGAAYIAFAGLGYPKKFFDFLKENVELNLVNTIAFADHYPYQESDIDSLKEMAEQCNAQLITTPKDYMRLPVKNRENIHVMTSNMIFDDEDQMSAFLKEHLPS